MGDSTTGRGSGDRRGAAPRKRSYAGPDAEPADDAEIARLEAIVQGGSAAEVRQAAHALVEHLRLRTWLHRKLVAATRLLDEQDRAGKRFGPMEGA